MTSVFDKILRDFNKLWVENLKEENHYASGTLANEMSWDTYLDTRGYHITIKLPEYAVYLNDGTKPHFPPVDKIKQWIKIKPVLPRPINGHLPTTDQLAYLVARKISKVGTPATHIIENTIDEFGLVDKLARRVDELLRREFEEL